MWRKAIVGLAILVLSAAAAPPASEPSKEQIADFLNGGVGVGPGLAQPLNGWFAAAKKAVAVEGVDGAAVTLAPGYGLTPKDMREVLGLWIGSGLDYLDREEGQPSRRLAGVRSRFQALIKRTNHSPLVMQAAAAVISELSDCSVRDFDALVGSDAALAVATSRAADCPQWYADAARVAPDRAVGSMIRLAEYGAIAGEEQMGLYGWLVTPEALAHVAPADRDQVAARLNRRYLRALFNAGLTDTAMAQVDGLSPQIQALVTATDLPEASFEIDGQPMLFSASDADDAPTFEIAAAELLAGRTAAARSRLKATGQDVATRQTIDCWTNRPIDGADAKGVPCPGEVMGDRFDSLDKPAMLDALLNRPDADPYPIAEVFFSTSHGSRENGVWADITCRLFSEPQYQDICALLRRATVATQEEKGSSFDGDDKATRELIATARPQGLEAVKAKLRAAVIEARQRYGGQGFSWRDRQSVDPLPSRFEQREIPASLRGAGPQPGSWIKSLTPLPRGFQPVRAERTGDRVAVVSLSQNYDPTGEVSGGGYWIHLSDDGGKTWRPPLYTGLAEMFPYVVKPTSKMQLFDGDTLNLAVDLRLLDTATITYPPVGLSIRRKQDNLYLRIPIAELTRDSDGDGLTDVAADHLLLSPGQDGEPGFVVGARPPAACADTGSADQEALGVLLKQMFSVGTGAIIEPADRSALGALGLGWRSAANSIDRPIFVEGPSSGFACIRPDRLMIVYSEAQIERLRRMSPDFHAVSLTVIFNRAHDRGYVVYSSGWSGGTMRLRKVDGRWVTQQIENWIT